MSRWIDAEWLLDLYQGLEGLDTPINAVVQNIKDAPTIDAVEIVRCKECKRWTDMGEPWGECRWSEVGNITLATTPDDYCSNGVRK